MKHWFELQLTENGYGLAVCECPAQGQNDQRRMFDFRVRKPIPYLGDYYFCAKEIWDEGRPYRCCTCPR
jgi:hypothetical protein